MPEHYLNALLVGTLFPNLSLSFIIKGKSTSTSGETTMWKLPIYKDKVKYKHGQRYGNFPQQSLGNWGEGYTQDELTLQVSA